jgi:hypothetical protein
LTTFLLLFCILDGTDFSPKNNRLLSIMVGVGKQNEIISLRVKITFVK